jgi:adenylate cyclase
MKLRTKFLLLLAGASLIPLVTTVGPFRLNGPWSIAIIAVGLLGVSALWGVLDHATPLQPAAPPPDPSTPSKILISLDPEKILDSLLPAVEEFVISVHDKKEPLDKTNLRKELRQCLGCVLEGPEAPLLDSEAREVTVVLSDLRGFSAITETYTAREVMDMLNRYFNHMCRIIYRYGGTVDKFIGDSIMALFGVPAARPTEVELAVCCAVEMQIAMDAFNKENEALGMPNLYMGIGVNTGEVVAGKIGSFFHSEYTVIGDEVNLASRIEGYSLRGQILISHNTYSRIKNLVTVRDPVKVSVKGKREPLLVYELVTVGEPYNLTVPDREDRKSIRVEANIPFEFSVCEGKILRSDVYEGRILNISPEGMLACTFSRVEPYSNIRFRLQAGDLGVKSDDVYGKIVRVKNHDGIYEMNIAFTSIDPEDRDALKDFVNQVVEGNFMAGV